MSGRFLSVDPHADSYPSLTPYNYCGNNPLNFIDPTGMDSTDSKKDQKKEEKETIPLIVTQVPIEKPDIKSLVDAIFRAIFGEEKQNTANTIYTNAESGQPPSTPDIKKLIIEGHAKDRMAERNVNEESVKEAVQNGRSKPGNKPNTTVYELPASKSSSGRGVKVVVNNKTGKVVTVVDKGSKYK